MDRSDPSLKEDYETARSKLEELDESQSAFRPSDLVYNGKSYNFKVTQEYACLTAEEFEKLIGVAPSHPSLKLKSISLPWAGPGSKNTTFFLMGFDGIPPERVKGLRTCTLEYMEGVVHEEIFLKPDDQLVLRQGARVFPFCLQAVNQKRGDEIQFATGAKGPLSYRQMTSKVQAEVAREVENEDAAVMRAANNTREPQDDFDELLLDEDDEAAAKTAAANMKKRACGLDAGGGLIPAVAKKKAYTGAKKGPGSAGPPSEAALSSTRDITIARSRC